MTRFAGLVALALTAVLLAFSPGIAEANGVPNISMSKTTDGNVLLGGVSDVTLTASNPTGQPTGYNLSFRDVLPAGISYVPGSAPASVGEPLIINNAPSAGQTTLIWENVQDLTPNSSFSFTFQVQNSATEFEIGDTYTNSAGSYLNCDPRFVPDFNNQGVPVQSGGNPNCTGTPPETSYTGWAEDSANTTIQAIEITKAEPSPEGQLLRGLHDHQTVYTLTVTNNLANPSNSVTVEDYLPAGLEFLGCGTGDNTTNSPSNPGSAEEYPGSGPINPGNAPAAPNCLTPNLVETVSNPPGYPAGIYTHVVWTNVANLAPSGTFNLQYVAAVPIRENTMTWTGATPPLTGAQGSNLDNNAGPETTHGQALTNHAKVTADYQGPGGPTSVTDDTNLTREAVDLRIVKSVDPEGLSVGAISHWTLNIATSEYRYQENVVITDTLGNGYCPLGPVNYEHTPPPASTECNPVAGENPTAPYSSAVEQADGTWVITWNGTSYPALGTIDPNADFNLTFPTRTRQYFQQNYQNADPILSNDDGHNDVDISGESWVICSPGAPSPCPNGDPDQIFNQWTNGTAVGDDSAADQIGSGPTIDKRVSPTLNGNCATLTDYASGIRPPAHPGDYICWRLTMTFPSNLATGNVRVGDFLPPNTSYIQGSTVALPTNTAVIASASPPEPDLIGAIGLRWLLDDGGNEVQAGKVFDVVFATEVTRDKGSEDGEIAGNLMKAVYTNTDGTTFPLRDQEDFELQIPEISLLKGVYRVDGQPPAGNPPNTDGVVVDGGQDVTYRVDLTNDGSVDAINTEVWDILPPEVTCADVDAGSISNGGTCNGAQNRIEWFGLTVPAGGALMLTYTVEIPDGLTGGDVLVNHAGVRQFASQSGSGPYVQIPEDNIDPTQEPNANAPAADDPSNVIIENSVLIKTRSTQINQPGNNAASQATIGERIDYTVTATIPEGTSLYGANTALVDNVSTRMAVVPLSASATLNDGTGGGPVPLPTAGLALTQSGNNIRISFPNPYSNPAHSGDDVIVLTFSAIVRDLYPNNYAQGTSTQYTLPNTATLSWQNAGGANRSASGSINTTVVEPRISIDKTASTAGPVEPNDIFTYSLQVSNASGTRVSTANDTVVIDHVPVGVTPVNGGVPVADGGTVNPDGGIWNLSARTITWPSISTINPGANVTRSFNVSVDDPAIGSDILVNEAEVRTTSMPGTPAVERDWTTNAPGYFAKDTYPLEVASPSIVKTGLPLRATIGQHVTVTIYASINANLTNYDGVVEDDLPNGLIFDDYISAECVTGCPTPIAIQTLGVVPNGNGQRIGWWIGDVPASTDNRMVALTYSAHVADRYLPSGPDVVVGDTLVNEATLLYNVTDKITTPPTSPPDPADFDRELSDDHTTTVIEPDLVLDKNVSGDDDNDDQRTTEPGDSYTYSISVTNNGNSPAFDVTVTDRPDVELTNVVVATDPDWEVTKDWSPSDRAINWFIPGPIDPGETITLTYTADLISSAQLINLQQVVNTADIPSYWGVGQGEREEPGNAGIDYRQYAGNDDTVTLIVLIPELVLDKTTGLPGFPDTGSAQTQVAFPWRVVITNPNAGSHLRGVDLTDTLPPNWRYVPGSAQITGSGTLTPGGQVDPTVVSNPSGDVLTWNNIANLTGVQNVIVSFTAVPQPEAAVDPGLSNPHVNNAKATGEDTSGATGSRDGPYEDEDEATATLEAPIVDLQITKTADDPTPVAGTNTTWTLVVRNNGPKVSPSVEVSDVLPAGLTYVSAVPEQGTCSENPAGTMFCELGLMANGDEVEIKLTTAVDPGTEGQVLTNPADVTDPNIDDPDPSNNHDEDDVTPIGSADLEIGKVVGQPLFAGQVGTYELTVTNNGPSVARDVTVTDTLPPNLTYAGSSTPVGSCGGSGQNFACQLGDLNPGQTVVIELQVNVLEGGEYTNCAQTGSETTDPDNANNESCVDTDAANTDLAIKKTGPPFFPEGKNRNYTLLVTNVGDQPTGGTTTVTDRIPNVLEPLAAFGSGWDCGIAGQLVTCTRSDVLQPGDSFPLITIRVQARENLLFRVITNTGHVHLPGDPNPSNDQDTVKTRKGAVCDNGTLALRPTFTWVGDRTKVNVTLRSQGGAAAADIPVRVRGNGKGGASKQVRTLRTDSRGRTSFQVLARSTKARWTVSVPQCNLQKKLTPKRQQTCRAMNVTPRSIDSDKTAVLTARLRSPNGRPLIGVTVIAKGQGAGAASRTNSRGIAKLRVRPSSAGLISVSAAAATRCRIDVGVRDSDSGSNGSQLTG